jgi:hypothetical protein
VLTIVANIKDKLKISEDDIKSIFHLLDEEELGTISKLHLDKLRNL